MDHLFKTRTLTTAINAMRKPGSRIFQRYFAPVLNWQPTSRIAWDIISGSERVLKAVRVDAPATVGEKTNRKTITMEAPRLAEKRLINNYEVLDMRRYGELATELMKTRIAREQADLRSEFDRTLEFWAAHALRGKIYDSDLVTVLVDYNMQNTHIVALAGGDRWSEATAKIIRNIRAWKRLIEQDSSHEISGFHAWCGYRAMDVLLEAPEIRDLLKYQVGPRLLEDARIQKIDGVVFEEYNLTFIAADGSRKYFIEPNDIVLVGEGPDVFDCPYLSAVSDEEMTRQLFFSNSWTNKDPAGRWIFGENRCAPVLKRPDATVRATVCDPPA